MDILQLEYFCSAAELENFTVAAKRHMIPQSAMSITIKRLEKELGNQLFDRIGNRIQLNEAGKKFYIHAKNCLTEFQNAKECVESANEPYGEVRLLVLEERRIMAELVAGFRAKYPRIRFSICHNLFEKPAFLYDICVTSSHQADNALVSAPILTEKLVLAVAKSHPLASRKQVKLIELIDEDFIMFPNGHINNHIVTDACQKAGFVPHISILCDDPFCIRKYVSAGLGISFIPSASWEGLLDNNIALIPLEDTTLMRKTRLERSKNSMSSSAVNLFYDYCLTTVKEYEAKR